MDMSALDRAVQSAGSQQALAQLLGIKPPSVSGWYDRCRVPAERCIAIELATGVSRLRGGRADSGSVRGVRNDAGGRRS
nr:helix-turn-helix domain-containing protein [Stenotrophomonas maltophilia]